ncbi:MAG: hypothetical protein M3N52_11760 [Actinomycetota bacterium]|nr:hypothetical protein [Actinomycetota bacterium]
MAPLVTPTDLAAYLQRDVDLATATLAVEGASGAVRDLCGWPISQQVAVTLHATGNGSLVLGLPTLLLTAVTAVRVDGTLVDPSEYVWVRRGQVRRANGWPAWTRVEVDCTHGYDPVPDVVRLITLSLAARDYGNPEAVESTVVGSVERKFFAPTPLDERLLEPYRLP